MHELESFPALLRIAPVEGAEQGPPGDALADGVTARRHFQKQDLLLNLRRQERQVHDLGDAGPGECKLLRIPGRVFVVTSADWPVRPVVRRGNRIHAGVNS